MKKNKSTRNLQKYVFRVDLNKITIKNFQAFKKKRKDRKNIKQFAIQRDIMYITNRSTKPPHERGGFV